jgi:hypothetical protein
MDAQLVWTTWRRVLRGEYPMETIVSPGNQDAGQSAAPSPTEIEILADYASTPVATDINIGMYRRGLVRNALAALSLVPLTRHLFCMGHLDVRAVAADFTKSTGYVDYGPNIWGIAADFIAYLATLPEFAAPPRRDVLALDAALVALARRLGVSGPRMWPEDSASSQPVTTVGDDSETARFVSSRAAVAVSSSHDLTAWIENPEGFDGHRNLDATPRHWLIYFPAADAAPEYAELSDRASAILTLLATPRTVSEVSLALEGVSPAEARKAIASLVRLGVVSPYGNLANPWQDHIGQGVRVAVLEGAE